MFDRGLFLTLQAVRRQLAAMPHDLYLIRLIDPLTKRAFPGERLWTAQQLTNLATIRFLRGRNREGCDIYVHPYAADHNAGYILVDLDHAAPQVLRLMRANGHEPCVVVQTSPGHWQVWIQVSSTALPAALATAIGRHLAQLYGGDRASTDWRHLGRLAGFTNQKPQRRMSHGWAPWVKLLHAAAGLASQAQSLWHIADPPIAHSGVVPPPHPPPLADREGPRLVSATQAQHIYQSYVRRWRISQRFQPPDWSIVDLWVARDLLAHGMPLPRVQEILRRGSPAFPRRHGDPTDYLQRTLARAFPPFSAPRAPVCSLMPGLPPPPPPARVRTPPAHDSPAPNAAVFGCTPSPEKPGCHSALRPDRDSPGDTPPRISASS
jgi:RepB DNA-primase N-terminal domain/RepB DNA-primase C-terminal helical domain